MKNLLNVNALAWFRRHIMHSDCNIADKSRSNTHVYVVRVKVECQHFQLFNGSLIRSLTELHFQCIINFSALLE